MDCWALFGVVVLLEAKEVSNGFRVGSLAFRERRGQNGARAFEHPLETWFSSSTLTPFSFLDRAR